MASKFYVFIAVTIFSVINNKADVINHHSISDNIIHIYQTTHNLDSVINNCHMRIKYPREGSEAFRVFNVEIFLTDTLSVIKTQDSRQYTDSLFSQVTLTKQTADYFKSLLFEIYSNNKSVIKDSILTKNTFNFSHPTLWSIKMNLPNQEIKESFNIVNYYFISETPFHIQFEKILQLIWAIKQKIEHDIYSLEDNNSTVEKWIKDKFKGNYYETSDIIY